MRFSGFMLKLSPAVGCTAETSAKDLILLSIFLWGKKKKKKAKKYVVRCIRVLTKCCKVWKAVVLISLQLILDKFLSQSDFSSCILDAHRACYTISGEWWCPSLSHRHVGSCFGLFSDATALLHISLPFSTARASLFYSLSRLLQIHPSEPSSERCHGKRRVKGHV